MYFKVIYATSLTVTGTSIYWYIDLELVDFAFAIAAIIPKMWNHRVLYKAINDQSKDYIFTGLNFLLHNGMALSYCAGSELRTMIVHCYHWSASWPNLILNLDLKETSGWTLCMQLAYVTSQREYRCRWGWDVHGFQRWWVVGRYSHAGIVVCSQTARAHSL